MRRLTAYITMSLATLLAVGVSFVPSVQKMNADLDYGSAHEVVYNLTNREDGSVIETNEYVADVASTMRDRLDQYNIDSYSVVVEGNDSIRVKFAAENDVEFNNVKEYLAFSGGDFSMATKEEESRRDHNSLFKDVTARIEYVNSIPYVVIPVSDVSNMKSLIEYAQSSHDDEEEEGHDHSLIRRNVKRAEGEEGSQADLYLWANWKEGDDFEKAEADAGVTGKKIIAAFNSSNIWYKNGLKDDAEPTEIQYLCGYADDEGNYDVNKLEEANDLAVKLRNTFNATSYEHVEVKVTYEKSIDAVVDQLVAPDSIKLSLTLVAIGVALVLMILFLAVAYRLAALGIAVNTITVSFLSMFFFFLLGSTMNVSALVGLLVVTLANIATSVYYMTKLKELVYKGYTLKKGSQECFKKYTLFTVDVSVVLAISGLALYLLGGNMIKSLGVVLFFGGVLNLLSNETVFRLLSSFLTSSSKVAQKINLINIDPKMIENEIISENGEVKETKNNANVKDYTKHSKVISGVAAGLVLVGAVMSTIFGIKNNTIINTNALTKDTTNVYLVIEYDESALLTIKNEEFFKENVLANIKVNGGPLAYTDVDYGTRSDIDYETTVTTKYDYYVTSFDRVFTNSDEFVYSYEGVETKAYSIEEAIYGLAEKLEPYVNATDFQDTAAKVSHETVINEPNFGWVSLACGISLIASGLYFAIRFKGSKAIATTIVGTAVTFTSIALFAITRIPASPVVYIVMPATMVIFLVGSLFYMNRNKELLNEVRSADLTPEKRIEIMKLSSNNALGMLLLYAITGVYFGVNFFGFGPSAYATLFAGIVVGTLLAILFIPTILGPISEFFAKLFAKAASKRVKREKPKKQQKIKLQSKPKTSEPEETIFIGIND